MPNNILPKWRIVRRDGTLRGEGQVSQIDVTPTAHSVSQKTNKKGGNTAPSVYRDGQQVGDGGPVS